MISAAPAWRTVSANGRGLPKDSITALGFSSSARSTAPMSIAQVRNPTPHGLPVPSVTRADSLASQPGSP